MAAGLNFDVLAQRAAGIPVPYSYALGPTPTPAAGAAGATGVAGGGSMPGTYSPTYGGIPQAPSMATAASGALSANLANLPSAASLASQSDAARWGSYISRFPNYQGLATAESGNINYLLGGGDPTEQWSRSAARNLYGGYAGSGFGANQVVKDIESDRIKKMALGSQLLTGALGRGQAVPTTDLNMYAVTPAQNYTSLLQQAIYGSAPIPSYAAIAAQNAALNGIRAGQMSGYGYGGMPTQTATSTPTGTGYQAILEALNKLYTQGSTAQPTTTQRAMTTNAYSPTVYTGSSYVDPTLLGTGGPYGNGMLYPELYNYSYDPNLGTGVYTPKPDEEFIPGYSGDVWPSDFFPEMNGEYYY